MKLYMVRHGESINNLEKRFTGQADAPLTDKGREDARIAGEKLKGLIFDRVYSSDLIRAVDTAKIALPGCEPVPLPLIRELSVGSLAGRLVSECEQEYGGRLWSDRNTYNYTPYCGENEADIQKRARDFLSLMESEPCEQVIAFSHAGFITSTLTQVLGVTFNRRHIACPNASIAVFSYDGKKWALERWGI